MLRTRLLTAAVLIPIVGWLICLGGLPYLGLVAFFMTLAQAEFCRLMVQKGLRLICVFGTGLVWLFLLDAQFPALRLLRPGVAAVLLVSLGWQLLRYRRSKAVEWAVSVATGLYVGLCGASLIALRSRPTDGLWWTLTVVAAALIADAGAYLAGSIWGRRKLVPRLSTGKTWEGYIGGVVIGGAATALLASLWGPVSGTHGLILGLLISVFAPLGDLAISMFKREASVKDSGNLFPGHGGALDRVDSVLWAGVIGYYYVLWVAG